MGTEFDPDLLARVAAQLLDAAAIDDVCRALEDGQLTRDSAGPRRHQVAAGNARVEAQLRHLQVVWNHGTELSAQALAAALRTVAAAIETERENAASPQVVWTGPRVEGSYLRATRPVVLDILAAAQHELLVVGYWIAAGQARHDTVRHIIEEMAAAVERGVRLRVVLDRLVRADGSTNRSLFLSLWPSTVGPPTLLTWRSDVSAHVKLHAKVLVADRRDALVTSANLTMHAMGLNMEMGVRIRGPAADAVADHFGRMISQDVLEPYREE